MEEVDRDTLGHWGKGRRDGEGRGGGVKREGKGDRVGAEGKSTEASSVYSVRTVGIVIVNCV